jgi:hypothetical protein
MQTRFSAMLQMGVLDMMITTREGVYASARTGLLRPVDEVKNYFFENNPQKSASLEDRIIFIYSDDMFEDGVEAPMENTVFAMAISLHDSPFLQDFGIETEDAYLCVIVNSGRFYAISKALEVLLYGA